jgi:hypothetical protein
MPAKMPQQGLGNHQQLNSPELQITSTRPDKEKRPGEPGR